MEYKFSCSLSCVWGFKYGLFYMTLLILGRVWRNAKCHWGGGFKAGCSDGTIDAVTGNTWITGNESWTWILLSAGCWFAVRMTHLGSLTRGSAKINRPSSLSPFVTPTRGSYMAIAPSADTYVPPQYSSGLRDNEGCNAPTTYIWTWRCWMMHGVMYADLEGIAK
jgi:hypothetical protein